ncbi:MAG: hypothetical protein M1281_07485 [Chloroflexi bacterium]|nr:hypothetical protein [Chloroflexota bacterium]
MTLPAFLFGFLASTLYGAAFHLWRGGSLPRLALYLALSWVGFGLGHFLGERLSWTFFNIGPLNLGMATLGSLVFLAAGYWLSLVQVEKK